MPVLLEQLGDLSTGLLDHSGQLVAVAQGCGHDLLGSGTRVLGRLRRCHRCEVFGLRLGLRDDLALELTSGLVQSVEKLISQLGNPRTGRSRILELRYPGLQGSNPAIGLGHSGVRSFALGPSLADAQLALLHRGVNGLPGITTECHREPNLMAATMEHRHHPPVDSGW